MYVIQDKSQFNYEMWSHDSLGQREEQLIFGKPIDESMEFAYSDRLWDYNPSLYCEAVSGANIEYNQKTAIWAEKFLRLYYKRPVEILSIYLFRIRGHSHHTYGFKFLD